MTSNAFRCLHSVLERNVVSVCLILTLSLSHLMICSSLFWAQILFFHTMHLHDSSDRSVLAHVFQKVNFRKHKSKRTWCWLPEVQVFEVNQTRVPWEGVIAKDSCHFSIPNTGNKKTKKHKNPMVTLKRYWARSEHLVTYAKSSLIWTSVKGDPELH